jgi:hypothetical protein
MDQPTIALRVIVNERGTVIATAVDEPGGAGPQLKMMPSNSRHRLIENVQVPASFKTLAPDELHLRLKDHLSAQAPRPSAFPANLFEMSEEDVRRLIIAKFTGPREESNAFGYIRRNQALRLDALATDRPYLAYIVVR